MDLWTPNDDQDPINGGDPDDDLEDDCIDWNGHKIGFTETRQFTAR